MAAQFVGLNSTFDQQRQVINQISIDVDNILTGSISLDKFSATGISTFLGPVSFGTSAYFGDNDSLYFGDGNDLRIYHNGTDSIIQDVGTGNLYLGSNGSRIEISKFYGTEPIARFNVDSSVELYYDNLKKFETTGAGATVFGTFETQQLTVSGVSTASSFVKSGGTSTQFLKADGSVDSNTYLTEESDSLDTITTRGNTTSNGISVGIITAQNGFTSGVGITNPVQITVIENIITFNVVGVGSTSLQLF